MNVGNSLELLPGCVILKGHFSIGTSAFYTFRLLRDFVHKSCLLEIFRTVLSHIFEFVDLCFQLNGKQSYGVHICTITSRNFVDEVIFFSCFHYSYTDCIIVIIFCCCV